MKKRMLALFCAAALALTFLAAQLSVQGAPGTLLPTDEKRVLKPGLVDEMVLSGTNMLTDYATRFGNVKAIVPGWTVESTTQYWGKTPAAVYTFYANSWRPPTGVPDSGLMYKVRPGTYVSVPVQRRVAGAGFLNNLIEKFWFDCSADGQTDWTVISEVAGGAETGTNPLRQDYTNNRVCYLTVQVPAGKNYLRIHFPSESDLSGITSVGGDWFDTGCLHIGYAKASAAPITAYTGEGAGDAVVDYYEDPAIAAKPRDPYPSGNGWLNRLVNLEGDRLIVRRENGAAVTLQNVADGLDLSLCSVEFYDGAQEITDLGTPVSNGIVMKGVGDTTSEVFAEYTMWVYDYQSPSLAASAAKRVLKPGNIDVFAPGPDGKTTSDYARVLGYMGNGNYADGTLGAGWPFVNTTYKDSNIQWGQAQGSYYFRYKADPETQPFSGLEYRVVPDTYFALPIRRNNTLNSIEAQLVPDFQISTDGSNWVAPDSADYSSFTYVPDNSSRTVYHVLHIPVGYSFVRAGFTSAMVEAIIGKTGTVDWVTNGAFVFGMAKASATPITGPTGAASGDPLVGWYDDSAITTKDVLKVNLTGDQALVRKVGTEKVTLQNVLDNLTVTLGEIKFFDDTDTEITDLSTEIADGQVIKGFSVGHLLKPDGTVFGEYTVQVNYIAEVKTPELKSNSDKITVDNGKKTITATFYADEPMTYGALSAALESTYSTFRFVTSAGAEYTDLDAELSEAVSVELIAKDCPGVPDGTVVATYAIQPDSVIKEIKFESKDTSKLVIDEVEKTVTVLEGMTVQDVISTLSLQFATLEFYDVPGEDFSDPVLITDYSTVIKNGMSLMLVMDSISIPYEFKVVTSLGGGPAGGDPADSGPGTGDASPAALLFGLCAAGMGAAALSVRRKRRG